MQSSWGMICLFRKVHLQLADMMQSASRHRLCCPSVCTRACRLAAPHRASAKACRHAQLVRAAAQLRLPVPDSHGRHVQGMAPPPMQRCPSQGVYPSSMLLAAPGVFEHYGMMFMPPWLLTMLPSLAGKSFEARSVVARNPMCKTDQTHALAGCARLLTSQAVCLRRSALTRCT